MVQPQCACSRNAANKLRIWKAIEGANTADAFPDILEMQVPDAGARRGRSHIIPFPDDAGFSFKWRIDHNTLLYSRI